MTDGFKLNEVDLGNSLERILGHGGIKARLFGYPLLRSFIDLGTMGFSLFTVNEYNNPTHAAYNLLHDCV